MPQAAHVAAPVHQQVPEPGPAAADAAAALSCPATGGTCPALQALFGTLAPSGEAARGWLLALAPCAQCRVGFESRRDALRHVRLGQREREILAAASTAGVLVLTEPGMSRSASAARRRAALSLGKAGLVAPAASNGKTQGSGSAGSGPGGRGGRAAVTLTDLGRYAMAAYGRYIRAGKPVRWTRPLKGVPLPGSDPQWLAGATLARTETALRDTLTELKGVLIAAVGGRFKDPDRLEAVTRHLEQKATLLRAALQPARPAATEAPPKE